MRFPKLHVLNFLADKNPNCLDEQFAIVGTQHLLHTTGSLVSSFFKVGLQPKHLYLLGKVYSSHKETVEEIRCSGAQTSNGSFPKTPGTFRVTIRNDAERVWEQFLAAYERDGISKLIVLDDGGAMRATIPSVIREKCKIVGIEQTTFGISRNPVWNDDGRLPVINVASSAAKRVFETPLIIEAINHRVRSLVNDKRCSVVGLGKIGLELFNYLDKSGIEVLGYDTNSERMMMIPTLKRCKNTRECISNSDFVFGCVGGDCLDVKDILNSGARKVVFGSCSSGDVEFQGILTNDFGWEKQGTNCPDFVGKYGKTELRVLRSGFPVNFDNSSESVPAQEIQLTRGLLLGAVIQAAKMLNQPKIKAINRSVMLLPRIQRSVVAEWARSTNRTKLPVHDLDWFESESKGVLIETE